MSTTPDEPMATQPPQVPAAALLVHPDSARLRGWTWREPTHGEHFRRCSWCGSIHPDDLAAEPVWTPNWADRKYGWPHKFYVDVPNRDPAQLFVTSARYNIPEPPPPGYGGLTWHRFADLTPDLLAIARRDGYGPDREQVSPDWVGFSTRPHHYGKFYTIHLVDPAVGADTREVIHRRGGLVFAFTAGRVSWQPYVQAMN